MKRELSGNWNAIQFDVSFKKRWSKQITQENQITIIYLEGFIAIELPSSSPSADSPGIPQAQN